ncbi:MAG TPA: protein phosphatase 2C domain-containing protein [Solirubrobacteraceae bacterium]
MAALTMEAAVLSEVGRREHNEDAVFASPRLIAVADGVGGAAAGEVASTLAVLKMIGLDKRRCELSLEQELHAAVVDANDVIAFASFCEPRHAGMATTLTAVALSNDGEYLVANVGDSRTYLFRRGQLRRLTRDDSLVQALIDQGVLSEHQARKHPQRSVVLEALDGIKRPLAPVQKFQARTCDRLLLCSDGVSDYLSDTQIAEVLRTTDARVAVRALVDLALAQHSRDNVTAVIVDIRAGGDARDGWLACLPAAGESG